MFKSSTFLFYSIIVRHATILSLYVNEVKHQSTYGRAETKLSGPPFHDPAFLELPGSETFGNASRQLVLLIPKTRFHNLSG